MSHLMSSYVHPKPYLRTSMSVGLSDAPISGSTTRVRFGPSSPTQTVSSSILSPKISHGTLGATGLYKPMGFSTFEAERNISYYSEAERLSSVNVGLKRQNDFMIAENTRLKTQTISANSRIPELEGHISYLAHECRNHEDTIRTKDRQLEEKDRRIDELRRQLQDYYSLDRTNAEISANNKTLLGEADKLQSMLRSKSEEIETVRSENIRLQSFPPVVDSLRQKIELLNSELADKNRELQVYKTRIQDLCFKIEEVTRENERSDATINNHQKELDLVKVKQDAERRRYEEELDEVRQQIHVRQRVAVDEARNEVLEQFGHERNDLNDRISEVNRKLKDYESKILTLTTEIERLNDSLSDKIEQLTDNNAENDALRDELVVLRREFEELRISGDAGRRVELENVKKNMKVIFAKEQEALEEENRKLRIELEEVERLNRAINNKEKENERLVQSMRNLEDTHTHRTNELNAAWDERLKLAVEREVRELGTKFIIEKNELEHEIKTAELHSENLEEKAKLLSDEIRRLIEWNEAKGREIASLKEESGRKELAHQRELSELRKQAENDRRSELDRELGEAHRSASEEIDRLRKKADDFETKVLALVEENSKLVNINEDHYSELEQLRLKVRSLEQRHETEIQEAEKRFKMEIRLITEREADELRTKYEHELSNIEGQYHNLEHDKRSLESKLVILEDDRARLSEQLKIRQRELEDLKRKLWDLENVRADEMTTLQKQFDAYKQASSDLNQVQVRYDSDRATQQIESNRYKEHIANLENKLEIATKETQRLNKELREQEENLNKYKRDSEEQLEELQKNSQENRETTIRYKSEKATYENKIRQLKTISENGKQEMEKLYDLMSQRKKEHEVYIKQNEDLRKQVEKLQKQLKGSEIEDMTNQERSIIKEREEELIQRLEELEKERKFFRDQAEKHGVELEKKNEELEEKTQELENLKRVCEVSIDKMGIDLLQKLNQEEK